ncbi:cation:dicarboxylase symporter family transporter, partial [Bacillus cereus]|nr:cation:dicarboxylase symporter family transporter [Bacillus cereus]
YVALIVMFVIHLIIIALNGLNPVTYVRKALPVLSFAFTSRTSAGALPLNVDTQVKKLGVSEGIANFSASFGLSIGQ